MIGSLWGLLAVGAILACGAMALLWLLQVRIRDASHVDVAWAVLIACAALAYALLADGDVAHRVLAAVLATVWGFRLGLYLLFNRVLGKEEDGRYQSLRAKWGERANRRFFWFFQFQAALVVFFSLPYAFVTARRDGRTGCARVDRRGDLGDREPRRDHVGLAALTLARRSREQGQDGEERPLVLVTPPELLLRVGHVARGRAGRIGVSVGVGVLARSGRPPLPPPSRHGYPGDGGASAQEPRGLRRVPADDELFRPASTTWAASGFSLTLRSWAVQSKRQPSPAANDFRILRATTMRCTSSGPS